ncbi:MAG TPA: gamma-glutamyltransferase [Balneolales bacterium]|nr:gamma-glutamyltransferase [Balneolales bacterium]
MNALKKLITSTLILFASLLFYSLAYAQVGIPKTYKKAIVVSATKEASEAGIEVMKEGGNAIDATAAVCFTLAVTYPEAGNIGGGGFMVVRLSNGDVNTLDFRETAPAGASRTMYQDKNGNVIKNLSREGALAVGVPGTVDGMINAVRKYGKLSLEKDMAPAIRYAQNGYRLSYNNAKALNYYRNKFLRYKGSSQYFTKPDSTLYHEGDLFKQTDLANTLKLIADKGRAGFYSGRTADLIVKEMKKQHGLITLKDLKNYHSIWRKPIKAQYDDYNLYMMAPPSSGGVAIKQILNMIKPYKIRRYGFNSAKYIHLMTEAERRVYADRAYYLGDPSFVHMPIKYLTSQSYLKKRMSTFSWQHATRSSEVSHGKVPPHYHESTETTHFSIVDSEGNAVSVTYTLNGGFGSHVSVTGAGFLLNNEMDDFSAKPGVPNMYGLLGGEANAIQPHKRMLSSMTPTIVTKNGKLNMVVGSPGGSTIITTVLQVFMNIADFGMNVQQAVAAPRVHNQWYPDQIFYDPYSFTNDTKKILNKMGHHLSRRSRYVGEADCIRILANGERSGGADPRGENYTAGY